MKNHTVVFMMLTLSVLVTLAGEPRRAEAAPPSSQWYSMNMFGDASNGELECYTPGQDSVNSGYLNITTSAQSVTCGPNGASSSSYNSGMVTWSTFHYLYGTIEFRAKMSGGQGTWPSIWLLGLNCQPADANWSAAQGTCNWPAPGSDEIDITEILNSNHTSVNQGIHTGLGANGTALHNDGCTATTTDTSLNFHVYDLIWAPGSLTWKIDGVTTCTINQSYVPNTAMFLIIDDAVGGQGGSINSGTLPTTMQVDYVKVTDQNGNVTFDDEFQPAAGPTPPVAAASSCGTTSPAACLSWSQPTQPTGEVVASVNVYKGSSLSGPFGLLTSLPDTALSYTDTSVTQGQSYYYEVTNVDTSSVEGAPSNVVGASIPLPPAPLQILTTTLASGTVGVSYSSSLSASGGTQPYVWAATGLPPGLSLNASTGAITGTPTQAGPFPVGITVTDSSNPAGMASATVTINVATLGSGTTTVRVVAGRKTSYRDSSGNTWSADSGYTETFTASGCCTWTTSHSISGTSDAALFQSERWGIFSYTFTLTPGTYAVTANFSENSLSGTGKRVFNVAVNGQPWLTNFDIFATAGAEYKATSQTTNVAVTGGSITLTFTQGSAKINYPKIDSIQIVPSGPPAVSVAISPTAPSILTNAQQQFTATVLNATDTGVTWTASAGTISSTGFYTAPATPGTYTVTATSVQDPTKSAAASVKVNSPPPSVSVSCTSLTCTITTSNVPSGSLGTITVNIGGATGSATITAP